ncbi:sensor histidine kinase [Flavobacterium difficile]|uniref:histidine kinase n=1 Tax=Flavobacterium difficile TaxID=2709659 RepID=A0ABX0I6P4_9FLAO|nr:HAMP domain-containing sensor histidine kinase [Flavobacterium difficile]NHM02366.1 HAMP domain-containing histidine kinase [Flavobacterium difficile]
MLFLTTFSTILITVVSLIHFRYEAKEYHEERLSRKESAIKEHIEYILKTTSYPLLTKNIRYIFKDRIHELSDIHSLEINFFDLNGKLLLSSKSAFKIDKKIPNIGINTLNDLRNSSEKRVVITKTKENDTYLKSSFSYIKDNKFKNLAILNIPYEENSDFYNEEAENFLTRYAQVFMIMFVISILLSYLLSRNITKSISQISEKLEITQLNKRNQKLNLQPGNQEINALILSYNNMVDTLEESAQKLAQSEREHAWREMAKQVAHEIKNPLTPMRLTIQSFQRKFDVNDPNMNQKLKDYSETLIQQIDTMTTVASAFSNFANMPGQQNEMLNIVQVSKTALEIFNEEYIQFTTTEQEILTLFDRAQLTRIVTNLVKNAIQAIPESQETKSVLVALSKVDDQFVLKISDNGIGISAENAAFIFEPKFTTKNSGMGLGLAIIKNIIENYKGTITFDTEEGKGTTFIVTLPIKN